MESSEARPLVSDPLAESLAGPQAMQNALIRSQKAPPHSSRKFKIGAMAIRTKWFDDQLQAALGLAVGKSSSPYLYISDFVFGAPRQVVLLGSGMDTRPWRLKLPTGLTWFEVDQDDVLTAKKHLLESAGAELGDIVGSPTAAMIQKSASANTLFADKIGTLNLASARTTYPLRAEKWEGVVGDLSHDEWLTALKSAGHSSSRPTVWVLEGLLMYLKAEQVASLFQLMAGVSAPGSVAIFMSMTEELIDDVKKRGGLDSKRLSSTWTFGCPSNPIETEKWMADFGWKLELNITRADMVEALRLDPEMCTFMGGNGGEEYDKVRKSLFMVATLL